MEGKLDSLLGDFQWGSFSQVYQTQLASNN
jgi:hypothetical protein